VSVYSYHDARCRVGDRLGLGCSILQGARCGGVRRGSCNETDLLARISVNVAVATQTDMMLAKPLGVDECISIGRNEQSRLLSILNYKLPGTATLKLFVIGSPSQGLSLSRRSLYRVAWRKEAGIVSEPSSSSGRASSERRIGNRCPDSFRRRRSTSF